MIIMEQASCTMDLKTTDCLQCSTDHEKQQLAQCSGGDIGVGLILLDLAFFSRICTRGAQSSSLALLGHSDIVLFVCFFFLLSYPFVILVALLFIEGFDSIPLFWHSGKLPFEIPNFATKI